MKKDKLSDLIPGIVLNTEELSNIVGGAAVDRPESLCIEGACKESRDAHIDQCLRATCVSGA